MIPRLCSKEFSEVSLTCGFWNLGICYVFENCIFDLEEDYGFKGLQLFLYVFKAPGAGGYQIIGAV